MLLSQDELLGICGVINEVLRGLPRTGAVGEFLRSVRLDESVEERLRAAQDAGAAQADVALVPEQADALAKAIDVVLDEIEDWELHTRVGVYRSELTALRLKLT